MITPVAILAVPKEEISITNMKNKLVLVIDVLRATSSIVMALENGARAVVPVSTIDEAYNIKQQLLSSDNEVLLAGEKDGFIIPGFDLGNSPQKFTPDLVANKIVVLKTTNGTPLINKFTKASHLIALSFLNITSVLSYVKLILERSSINEIIIAEAGDEGRISPPDHLCATLFLSCLRGKRNNCKISSTVIQNTLLNSFHGLDLINKGLIDDILFSAKIGMYKTVPIFDKKTRYFVKSNNIS